MVDKTKEVVSDWLNKSGNIRKIEMDFAELSFYASYRVDVIISCIGEIAPH